MDSIPSSVSNVISNDLPQKNNPVPAPRASALLQDDFNQAAVRERTGHSSTGSGRLLSPTAAQLAVALMAPDISDDDAAAVGETAALPARQLDPTLSSDRPAFVGLAPERNYSGCESSI